MTAVTPTDYAGGSPFIDVFTKGGEMMSDWGRSLGIPGIGNGEPTLAPPQVTHCPPHLYRIHSKSTGRVLGIGSNSFDNVSVVLLNSLLMNWVQSS